MQVCIRETNESEPFDDASLRIQVSSKPGACILLGQVRRVPDDWAGGDRRRGGVNRMQAMARNCRNQSLRCQGRSTSGENREARVPMRSTGADRPVGAMKAL